MITPRQLASEIIRLEAGGHPSRDTIGHLNEKYVILLVRQACNKVLEPHIFQRLNDEDPDRNLIEILIVPYTVDVLGSAPNKYSDIPEIYHNVRFNKGLYGVAPVDDPSAFFIPRLNPSVSINLPCATLEEGQNSYWTLGLKVYFDETMDLAKVLMYLFVVAPDSVGVDSSLPLLPGMQVDVINLVRQMLRDQPIKDAILDNNKDIGVRLPR